MYSLDFEPIARLELEDHWEELAIVLVDTAKRLERAGAEFILLADYLVVALLIAGKLQLVAH